MERYTKKQAETEAESITRSLEQKYPKQGGSFTKEQYDEAEKKEAEEIYKTAMGTIMDLALYAGIPGAKEIWESLEDEGFSGKVSGKPHLLELRYKMSEKVIKESAEKEGIRQAVEIASGFTPHAVELLKNTGILTKYVESDFPINTNKKREIMKKLFPELPIDFVPGNIFEDSTWLQIEEKLNEGPVAIFTEGFILYTTQEERERLAKFIKKILEKHGGYFMFEDSMRYHPELKNSNFQAFLARLSQVSQREMNAITQEEMEREWRERGFEVERIPENIPLVSEKEIPVTNDELEVTRKNFKMWKLSLPQKSS